MSWVETLTPLRRSAKRPTILFSIYFSQSCLILRFIVRRLWPCDVLRLPLAASTCRGALDRPSGSHLMRLYPGRLQPSSIQNYSMYSQPLCTTVEVQIAFPRTQLSRHPPSLSSSRVIQLHVPCTSAHALTAPAPAPRLLLDAFTSERAVTVRQQARQTDASIRFAD